MQQRRTTEEEMIQQIVYNMVLYLPLQELGDIDGLSIKRVVERAREHKNNGDNVDEVTLEMLEACLKEESGISDIGNARLTYISFKKDANELVEHGISRKNAELITNPDAMVAVAFVYEGSEAQGIREGLSFVHRGTPGGAWEDNYDM